MRKTIILLLISIFAISFTACQDKRQDAIDQLKEVSEDLNTNDVPIVVDEITSLTKTDVTPTDWVYIYTGDDSGDYEGIMEMIGSEEGRTQLHEQNYDLLKEQFSSDSDVHTAMTLIQKAGLGVIYRYVGKKSGSTIDVLLTPEEIAGL